MGECRSCVTPDKKDWLIGSGSGPRGVQPPKKPPERIIEKEIPWGLFHREWFLSSSRIDQLATQNTESLGKAKPMVAIDECQIERNSRDSKSKKQSWKNERQIAPTLNEQHTDGQIEQNDKQSPTYDWQVEWQEQAEKQIEHSDGQSKCIDWPNNLVEIIKGVMNVPYKAPHTPEFIFELSESAALHNLEILNKNSINLGKALRANENSSLGYGPEFWKPQEFKKVFGFHPLWSRMESILRNGSKWPLEEISKVHRKRDLDDALSFGNHNGLAGNVADMSRHVGDDTTCCSNFGQMGPCRRLS